MRLATLASAAVAAALVSALGTGCVSQRATIQGAVILGPGGRAEGRLEVPEGGDVALTLRNDGPGGADFVVRDAGGQTVQEGTIGDATVKLASTEPQTIAIVLEAYEDQGATVVVTVQATGRIKIGWDLSRAAR